MVQRHQNLKTRQNLFLFGARGTGKSTLLKRLFPEKGSLRIDLLDYKQESRLSRNPDRLSFLLAEDSFYTQRSRQETHDLEKKYF